MSAQPAAELLSGAEPPWLKAEPSAKSVTFWLVKPRRSICSICPYFSFAVICFTRSSARLRQAGLGNGGVGSVPPVPPVVLPPAALPPEALPPLPAPPADCPPDPPGLTTVPPEPAPPLPPWATTVPPEPAPPPDPPR